MMWRSRRRIVNGRVVDTSHALDEQNIISQCCVSWHRVLFVLGVGSLFILTNPAKSSVDGVYKDDMGQQQRQQQQQQEYPFDLAEWMTRTLSSMFVSRPQNNTTNYLFFSVQSSYQALSVYILGGSWDCRYDDLEFGDLCQFLTPHLAQGEKAILWDPQDPVHTAHRMLGWMLVGSAILHFCSTRRRTYFLFLWDNPILRAIFGSVFDRPHLIYDLGHLNWIVYPALQELYAIVPQLKSNSSILKTTTLLGKEDWKWEFAVWVGLLVFGIGGGSNYLTSLLIFGNDDEEYQYGFSTIVAACMAYQQRIHSTLYGNPSIIVGSFDGILTLHMTDLYWAECIGRFLISSSSRRRTGQYRRSLAQGVAWILAGVLGSAMAKYQLENLYIWGGVLQFLGWV